MDKHFSLIDYAFDISSKNYIFCFFKNDQIEETLKKIPNSFPWLMLLELIII